MKQSLFLFILSVLLWNCAPKVNYVISEQSKNQNLNDDYGSVDEGVLKTIAPYKDGLDSKMNKKIGTLTGPLDKNKPSSTLTNFMADAMLFSANKLGKNIDAAMMNYGGVRITNVPPGDLTVGRMYELMPFDNTLVIMNLDRATAQKLFDKVAASNGWPMSKNVVIKGSLNKAKEIILNGKNMNELDSVMVALPSYISDGGDDCYFLIGLPKEDLGVYIRDVLIDYVSNIGTIIPDNTQRIIISNE